MTNSKQMNSKQLTFALLAPFLLTQAAHAIRGEYLPESELPKNVCRIVIGNVKQTFQPSMRNGHALKHLKPVIFNSPDQIVCSANLVAPDLVLTAAHCFEGNNEWRPRKGSLPYPILDKDGNRPAGCEGNDYLKKDHCIQERMFGVITTEWQNTRIECPNPSGIGFTARPLQEEMGYPNPFYRGNASENRHTTSISISNFDFAFYKLERPITNIEPMEVVWDFEEIDQTLRISEHENPNPFRMVDQCRSFGYGTDNSGNSGILRGANTPVTSVRSSYIMSGLDSTISIPNVGHVDHGDSGGALMCRGKGDRRYRLFGIVSRGLNRTDIDRVFESGGTVAGMDLESIDELKTLIAKSYYSLPSHNRLFFDYAMKKGAFPRPSDKRYWYQLFMPYQKNQVLTELGDAKSCIDSSKREMTRSTYREYKDRLQMIYGLVSKAEKDAFAYGNDPGLFLAKVQSDGILEKSRDLLWHCQGKVYFKDL